MSRVGKLPIPLPSGVNVSIDEGTNKVTVKGNLGSLDKQFNKLAVIKLEDNQIIVTPRDESKHARAMWGMARSIINNMVKGVSAGYKEELEINGVGFRSSLKDDILTMNLGFSHSVKIRVPKDIKVNVVKNTNIEVSGIDKQRLGQFLSLVISQRPVEPYKGKGIKIKGQVVIRKEGKKK